MPKGPSASQDRIVTSGKNADSTEAEDALRWRSHIAAYEVPKAIDMRSEPPPNNESRLART
jgi:hypothetical protein